MRSTDLPKTLLYFKVFASFSGHLKQLGHPSPSAAAKGRSYFLIRKKKKSYQNKLIFVKINVQCTILCWYSFLSTWLWICFCYKNWRHQTGNFCPLWERLLPLSGGLFSLWCAQDPCGHCWLKLTCCTDFFLPKWCFILSRCKEKQRH